MVIRVWPLLYIAKTEHSPLQTLLGTQRLILKDTITISVLRHPLELVGVVQRVDLVELIYLVKENILPTTGPDPTRVPPPRRRDILSI